MPRAQIGCLLGRGGQIIESMRRETGASIQVLPSESLPLCAEEGDELVEINGEPAPLCYAALRLVTARLRANPPRDRLAKGGNGAHPLPSQSWWTTAGAKVTERQGLGGRKALEKPSFEGRTPNSRGVRVHASTGYHRVERNRRASRNGRVSDLPPEIPHVTIRNFSHRCVYPRSSHRLILFCRPVRYRFQASLFQPSVEAPSLLRE